MFSKRLSEKIKTNFAWSVISEDGERISGSERLSEEAELNTSGSGASPLVASLLATSPSDSPTQENLHEEEEFSLLQTSDDTSINDETLNVEADDVEPSDQLDSEEATDSCEPLNPQNDEEMSVRKFAVIGSWDDVEEEKTHKVEVSENTYYGSYKSLYGPYGVSGTSSFDVGDTTTDCADSTDSTEFIPIPCDISGELGEFFDNSKRTFRAENVSIKVSVVEEELIEEPVSQKPSAAFRSAAMNRSLDDADSNDDNYLGTVHLPPEMMESSIFLSEPIISRTVSFLSNGELSESELKTEKDNLSDKKAVSIEFKTRSDKERKTNEPKRCG